jgi:hypothetical protein
MGLGLMISGVISVRGIIILIVVVRDRVVVITVGRGCAWMGKERKGSLSATPVVNHNVHGGEKKRQNNPTTHEAHHG